MSAPTARMLNGRRGIFLYGYYGAGNLGDDLLLLAALDILRGVFPEHVFFVRDHGDTRALQGVGSDVTFTGIESVLADRGRTKFSRFARYLGAYLRVFRRCDWLVFGGGTVFHETASVRPLLLQWLMCIVARVRGLRIAALGVGIGDLRSPSARWLLARIVCSCEIFLVRDEAAMRQCALAGVAVQRTGDLAFGLAPVPRSGAAVRRMIAVTICPSAYPTPQSAERAVGELVEAMRGWHRDGWRIALLIFQRAGVTPGDAPMLEIIRDRLGSDVVDVRTVDPDGRAIENAFSDVAVVCGMRFHALVLAAAAGIPFVGLAHDNKIEDICRRFDMPMLSAFTFAHQDLIAAVARVAGTSPDKRVVAECVAGAAANAVLLRRIASP
jgi:polysaccharide pyruvyl transferase WcaK-like protein